MSSSHPAQTIHRNASASSNSMPRSFNNLQDTNRLAVANTSSSSMEQYLPPYEYQTPAPNVAGNMYHYHPPGVFIPNHNIRGDVTNIRRTNNTVQFQNVYAPPNSFRITPRHDQNAYAPNSFGIVPRYDTQASTNFSPPGVPAVGSDFEFYPPQVYVFSHHYTSSYFAHMYSHKQ